MMADAAARRSRLDGAVAALAVGIALVGGVVAALGVFVRGDGSSILVTTPRGETFEMATTGVYAWNAIAVVAEGVGWDVFTMVVAAPTLLVAALVMARGSFRGTLVTAGMLGYFLYLHLEYAVTWAFGPLFVAFVALFAASLVGLVGITAVLARDGVAGRFDERFPRRSWAALSLGMSALLVVMWAGRIVEALAADVPTLHGEVTMTVQALDLGLVVPMSTLIAVAALRRSDVGLTAAAAFSTTFVAMTAAIAAMMVSSWIVTGVPAVEPIAIFAIASVLGAGIAARMHRSVVGGRRTAARVVPRPQPAPG
jgi:hypothetical protein